MFDFGVRSRLTGVLAASEDTTVPSIDNADDNVGCLDIREAGLDRIHCCVNRKC